VQAILYPKLISAKARLGRKRPVFAYSRLALLVIDHLLNPLGQCIQQFDSDLGILASGAGRDMKRMIRILKQPERRLRAQFPTHSLQKLPVCEFVASPLQKEHGNLHIE
jgi:hypothetical protein